jgi:hypothetical protein
MINRKIILAQVLLLIHNTKFLSHPFVEIVADTDGLTDMLKTIENFNTVSKRS